MSRVCDVLHVRNHRCGSEAWEGWLWRQKVSLHPEKRAAAAQTAVQQDCLLGSEKVFTVPQYIYHSSFSKVLFSVILCPTSAGAHSMLRLKRLEDNVTTLSRRTRPAH